MALFFDPRVRFPRFFQLIMHSQMQRSVFILVLVSEGFGRTASPDEVGLQRNRGSF